MKQKAIIFVQKNRALLLEDIINQPKSDEVLVKIHTSTISSGTERANITGDPNISIAKDYTPKVEFPRTAGYSSSGVIEKVGENVSELKPGDRVVVSWSSHRQYVCVKQNNVYKLDDEISFSEAALWHISTFPLLAIRKCKLELGESAMVMGQGVLGMMAVKLLKAAGAVPVVAVDPIPEKRAFALKNGADFAFSPFDQNFEEEVRSVTNGGVNVCIEVTGNGKALDSALDVMQKFGRVALLGCTRNSDFTIDYYRKVHGPGITLIGAHTMSRPVYESAPAKWTTHDDIGAVQKLVKLGRLEFKSLVAETHSPTEAPEVYSRLAKEKYFPVVQFDWSML